MYACVAINDVGKATCTARLSVESKSASYLTCIYLPQVKKGLLEPRNLSFYLTYILLSQMNLRSLIGRKEGNVLFNDALNTFCLRLYGVGHMVKDHSDSERGNPLLPHGLLFPINSKGSFICTIPQTG